MLPQTSSPSGLSARLQVEAGQPTSPEIISSYNEIRRLRMALGLACLALMGVSAWAVLPHASLPDSAESSTMVAFNPGMPLLKPQTPALSPRGFRANPSRPSMLIQSAKVPARPALRTPASFQPYRSGHRAGIVMNANSGEDSQTEEDKTKEDKTKDSSSEKSEEPAASPPTEEEKAKDSTAELSPEMAAYGKDTAKDTTAGLSPEMASYPTPAPAPAPAAVGPLDVSADVLANPMFLDEPAMLDAKSFPIPPNKLIELTKRFLASRSGLGADPDLLSEDFQFFGPVVGPLTKKAFVQAIGSVDFATAFPDFSPEFYGFVVDPLEADRVWYTARGKGTNSGPLPPFAPQGTGKKLVNPPQACSVTFGKDGLVKKYTIGYVMDRTVGNTGGLGGLYGVLYAIGKPLPFREAQPWRMSNRYKLFQAVGDLLSKAQAMR